METIIGMILAFMLGAYVRQPFKLREPKETENTQVFPNIDKDIMELLEKEAKKEQERQLQMYNIMNWNGEKGRKLIDE